MKKSKVYVATQGNYSAYHIEAIFTDIEKAKKYIEPFQDSAQPYEIETYEINVNLPSTYKQGYQFFEVSMYEDGEVPLVSTLNKYPDVLGSFYIQHRHNSLMLRIKVRAKDRKHAIKIADEKRTYLIENNLFYDGYNSEKHEKRKNN